MKRCLTVLLAAVFLCLCRGRLAYAASAEITLTTDNETPRTGEEFNVTLAIRAYPDSFSGSNYAVIGDFEGYFIYDSEVFEFVCAPDGIMGGNGLLKISDLEAEPSRDTRSYVLRFKAIKKGIGDFFLDETPFVWEFQKGERMSVSLQSLTISTEAAQNASSNANLSALKVSPGQLTPTFATTLREYEVSVSNDTDMIVVSALTEDPNAIVSVSGSTNLSVGRNKVIITVTAENGTEKRYYLYVTREAAAVTKMPLPTAAPTNSGVEKGIHAEQHGETTRILCGTEYEVCRDPDEYTAPTGYEETVLFLDGIRVRAYAKRDTEQREFYILLLYNPQGQVGYYRYDTKEQTIQRMEETPLEIKKIMPEENGEYLRTIRDYKDRQVILIFLVALLIGVTAFLLLVILGLLQKNRKEKEEDDDFF